MKNPKVIIAVIVVIIVILFIFKSVANNKSMAPSADNVSPIEKPTLVPVTPTTAPAVTQSKYSVELKAKVRSEFINTCHTKGKYSLAVCTCGADYLSANYSESDLAKMYLDYHTNNVVPKALEIAADKCSK